MHDRLVGFSGFDAEYEKVLAYHTAEKRHEVVLDSFHVLGEEHVKRIKSHPHQLSRGIREIDSKHEFVVACARGLQTLNWRRMDFEIQSMFVHDSLVASPSISCCGMSNDTRYGWKVLGKIAKVVSLDHELK